MATPAAPRRGPESPGRAVSGCASPPVVGEERHGNRQRPAHKAHQVAAVMHGDIEREDRGGDDVRRRTVNASAKASPAKRMCDGSSRASSARYSATLSNSTVRPCGNRLRLAMDHSEVPNANSSASHTAWRREGTSRRCGIGARRRWRRMCWRTTAPPGSGRPRSLRRRMPPPRAARIAVRFSGPAGPPAPPRSS